MKNIRIVALIVLGISLLVSADLGYNFFASLVPEMNDGIALRGIVGMMIFPEDSWSTSAYLSGFAISAAITILLGIANIALGIISLKRLAK